MHKTIKLEQKAQKISNPFTRALHVTHGTIPRKLPIPAFGIDPGVNFGMTVIAKNKVWVFHGSLTQTGIPGKYGETAYAFLNSIMGAIEEYPEWPALMVIEGASYGDRFGQVLLSEVRQSFYLAAAHSKLFANIVIQSPKKIRKQVFGDGNKRGPQVWPKLNKNGADSLVMALFAAQYTEA
jgi:hypothetical protein